jgi:hypothetical protein
MISAAAWSDMLRTSTTRSPFGEVEGDGALLVVRRMVEKHDFETIAIVQFENALHQLHRRVIRPEVRGEVADADLVAPAVRHLATHGGVFGRHAGAVVDGKLVHRLVAAPMQVEERVVEPHEVDLAGSRGRIYRSGDPVDLRQIGEFAAEDEVERPERRVLRIFLEQGFGNHLVAVVVEIVGQKLGGHRQVAQMLAVRQNLLQPAQQFLLLALQQDLGEHKGNIRVFQRLGEDERADRQHFVLVAAVEMQQHGFAQIVFPIGLLSAGKFIGIGRLRLEAELCQRLGEQRVALRRFIDVDQLVKLLQSTRVVTFLEGLRGDREGGFGIQERNSTRIVIAGRRRKMGVALIGLHHRARSLREADAKIAA